MKRCALTLALSVAVVACQPAAPPPADAAQVQAAPAAQAAPYQVQTFNPGAQAIFQVASNLVIGANEVLLVDAQFAATDAQRLVEQIRATGKPLKTIFISHGDPDYYFGLATVLDAFPQARVIATPTTVAHIRESAEGKLAYWKPIMGEQAAPARLVTPEPFAGKTLDFDGGKIEIFDLDGPTPDRSVLWIPAIHTVLGGVPVMAGEHVWMADTQTPQSHADWLALLDGIAALKPERVVPGHFAEGAKQDLDAVRFTGDYIRAFDEETPKAANAEALITAMKQRYPDLAGEGSLDISAKVAKGEMKWP